MLFNSSSFAIFLPIVFFLYWFTTKENLKLQNILLLVSSYFFYACWDWRFLFLLIFSTLLDYFTGIKMSDAKNLNSKKFWFWSSISVNLGFLGVFKYYNFFAESFASALVNIGLNVNPWTLKVILPVGISFYTFHGLSYVIDIYKDRIKAEKNFIDYSVFVSFFPLLVAGPIERATHLLPQIKKKRTFDYSKAVDGLRQILWGLFKKVVIADQCAEYANQIFNNTANYSGSTLVLGAIFFTFQIYGDFSGYSDIALGTARLFGIDLLRNFDFPYFSRDIAEFWRRWHISLSSWFKDYVYIPLGGSKEGKLKAFRNTIIIFILSGFWHGASWNFIVWGGIHACGFLPLLFLNRNRNNVNDIVAQDSMFPNLKELGQVLGTFLFVSIAWVFFRAHTLTEAVLYLKQLTLGLFQENLMESLASAKGKRIFLFIVPLLLGDWYFRKNERQLKTFRYQYIFYFVITLVILYYFFNAKSDSFIYVQF
jgi:D-alanyl-lipoteichoic acid acyltransferase DltB (MBOAT superfamily)